MRTTYLLPGKYRYTCEEGHILCCRAEAGEAIVSINCLKPFCDSKASIRPGEMVDLPVKILRQPTLTERYYLLGVAKKFVEEVPGALLLFGPMRS